MFYVAVKVLFIQISEILFLFCLFLDVIKKKLNRNAHCLKARILYRTERVRKFEAPAW